MKVYAMLKANIRQMFSLNSSMGMGIGGGNIMAGNGATSSVNGGANGNGASDRHGLGSKNK